MASKTDNSFLARALQSLGTRQRAQYIDIGGRQNSGTQKLRSSALLLVAVTGFLAISLRDMSILSSESYPLLLAENRVLAEEEPSGDFTVDNYNNHGNRGDIEALRGTLSADKLPLREKEEPYEMYFLNHTQLSLNDGFSATWLQTKESFLAMPFDTIHTCEDAAFRAFDKERNSKMLMTLDYLDFSVEHMSKWWKILLKWDTTNSIPLAKMKQQFQTYIQRRPTVAPSDVFQHTLAVIAFQKYQPGGQANATLEASYRELTTLSLAATIESLRRAGYGRVVVSGTGDVRSPDYALVQDAFRTLVEQHTNSESSSDRAITNIGHLEVGYAAAPVEYMRTSSISKNIPKAAIMGLRDAFLNAEKDASEQSGDTIQNMTKWLGTRHPPSYWKYVYLTEPDSLLQTRPSALAGLAAEMNKGYVLLPHRLQPIPHESDVRGMSKTDGRFVHETDFPNVLELDTTIQWDTDNENHDACCDENRGPNHKPGKPPTMDAGTCNHFFYACGFLKSAQSEVDPHRRLRPYGLMRLSGGTGISSLAGTVHGRRCIPQKNSVCRPSTDI